MMDRLAVHTKDKSTIRRFCKSRRKCGPKSDWWKSRLMATIQRFPEAGGAGHFQTAKAFGRASSMIHVQ